jgi:hypothetical protein
MSTISMQLHKAVNTLKTATKAWDAGAYASTTMRQINAAERELADAKAQLAVHMGD